MKRSLLSLFVILFLTNTMLAAGAPQTETRGLDPAPQAQPAPDNPFTVDITLDYTSQYFFRGYNLNPGSDVIFQPGAEFAYKVFDNGTISLTPYAGVWTNFADADGPDSPKNFYEVDVYGGVKLGYDNFELGVVYTLYSAPNRSFGQTQELGFTLSYDDSALWENTPFLAALNPRVGYYIELEDRGDNDRGTYVELGLEPTFKPVELFSVPVTFSVPVVVGLSGDGYFASADGSNETVGFYSVGVKASLPLTFIKAGDWSLTTGVDYINLTSDSAKAANGGDNEDFVFRVGIGVSF